MTNVQKRPPVAKKAATQKEEADLSSDLKKLKENVEELGNNVGNMASRQYERVQEVAKDAVQETGETIRRNPFATVATALGLGFLFGWFKHRG
jgi:ElaB/YqjD/DUF883 family membrane-anchored ribosome-binding protein